MNINDVVVLRSDLPGEGLKKGTQGVIVAIFEKPELAYEVEFCDAEGRTLAEIALKPDLIERIRAS
jgi:hypothetical protein